MTTNQTAVQQLIQSLAPRQANNGNPNTVYNTAATPMQPATAGLPPMADGLGNWFQNGLPQAAFIPGLTVPQQPYNVTLPQVQGAGTFAPWQAPVPAGTPNLPVWSMIPVEDMAGGWGSPPPTGGPNLPPTGGPLPPTTINHPRDDMGGGGDTIGCVVVESHIEGFGRAGDVKVGDSLTVIDPVTFERSKASVSYSEAKMQPVVRIVTKRGIVLECSKSAPIADELGNQIMAKDLLGVVIPVVIDKNYDFDTVMKVDDLGEQLVQHITCENNFFLAGKEEGEYLLHHNIKIGPGTNWHLARGELDPNWMMSFGGGGGKGGWSEQFGATGMGGTGTTRPPASSPGPNPFTAEGAAEIIGATNPYKTLGGINTNDLGQLSQWAQQSFGAYANSPFPGFQVFTVDTPSESQAAGALNANEAGAKGFLASMKVNATQAWNYIKAHKVQAALAFARGPAAILVFLAKAGIHAATTKDK